MSTLLLPVAGKSSRFPGMRPKWLLTLPNGNLMVEESVSKLDRSQFNRVVLICLKEHIDDYLSEKSLNNIIDNIGIKDATIVQLEEPTKSQSETIAKGLEIAKVNGPILIKDCDNRFACSYNGKNQIAVIDLNDVELVDAKNKSYVSVNKLGHVTNIVEKRVISNLFCCGGYGFSSAENFLKHFHKLSESGETYVSHVIFSMLTSGEEFTTIPASSYVDWGTLKEYRDFQKKHITVFCDLDGVLFENGSKFGSVGWNTPPIKQNISTLARLQSQEKLYLVITSSRPETEIQYVKEQLAPLGLIPDKFVMGLPHNTRMLINDFSTTTSYPSAMAVNIERNSTKLSSMLDAYFNT